MPRLGSKKLFSETFFNFKKRNYMNLVSKRILIVIAVGCLIQGIVQSQDTAKTNRLHSISGNIGHHSIGWPFAFRLPYHFNIQIDANWAISAQKPNQFLTTSIGFTDRPDWTKDVYFLLYYNPKFKINNKLYYSCRVGGGILLSHHQNQIYVFKNGQFDAKDWNTKLSSLIQLGLEVGYELSDKIKIGIVHDWRPQIPHGGGLPFLPHSIYNLKVTYILK